LNSGSRSDRKGSAFAESGTVEFRTVGTDHINSAVSVALVTIDHQQNKIQNSQDYSRSNQYCRKPNDCTQGEEVQEPATSAQTASLWDKSQYFATIVRLAHAHPSTDDLAPRRTRTFHTNVNIEKG
jgi:hypothetical protein